MVKSTNLKTDSKGGIKPIKKTSSLYAIMKLGGASGVAGTKGSGREKGLRHQSVAKESDARAFSKEKDEDMKDTAPQTTGEVELMQAGKTLEKKGGESSGKGMVERVLWSAEQKMEKDNEEVQHLQKEGANEMKDHKAEIGRWENEIKCIEEVMSRPSTSKERKESLTIQLSNAQVMLKQALITASRHVSPSRNVEVTERGAHLGDPKDNEKQSLGMDIDEKEQKENDKVTGEKDKGIGIPNKKDDEVKNLGKEDDIQEVSTFNPGTHKKNKEDEVRWADMSDDETVVLNNMDDKETNEAKWQIVGKQARKQKERKSRYDNLKSHQDGEEELEEPAPIPNPYIMRGKGKQAVVNDRRSSLMSYMETVIGKQRAVKANELRITTAFTPRTAGTGDFRRVAIKILKYTKEFNDDTLLLPWDKNSELGPISLEDLENPHTMYDIIKHYFDKPPYVNWQPGVPVYGVGIRISTNMGKYEFLNKWNVQKREYKAMKKVALTINLAPMQKSNKAFIIGIAVGSTENQDYEILNKKLEEDTGIKGIEASFQNVNQSGIPQEFWKMANKKANKANKDKFSREHLRTKYTWAPNALAIYVPNREAVNAAWNIMIQKYGKSDRGVNPVWPDGTSMRFLPIKGNAIKNTKTKEIVRKRMAFHIWLKASEISLDTTMKNIHGTCEFLGGISFAEAVLATTDEEGNRVFSHFNRAWTNDPSQQKWALSVQPHLLSAAQRSLNNIQETLCDLYGNEVNEVFKSDSDQYIGWTDVVNRNNIQEDDDDWFDD